MLPQAKAHVACPVWQGDPTSVKLLRTGNRNCNKLTLQTLQRCNATVATLTDDDVAPRMLPPFIVALHSMWHVAVVES